MIIFDFITFIYKMEKKKVMRMPEFEAPLRLTNLSKKKKEIFA